MDGPQRWVQASEHCHIRIHKFKASKLFISIVPRGINHFPPTHKASSDDFADLVSLTETLFA